MQPWGPAAHGRRPPGAGSVVRKLPCMEAPSEPGKELQEVDTEDHIVNIVEKSERPPFL